MKVKVTGGYDIIVHNEYDAKADSMVYLEARGFGTYMSPDEARALATLLVDVAKEADKVK